MLSYLFRIQWFVNATPSFDMFLIQLFFCNIVDEKNSGKLTFSIWKFLRLEENWLEPRSRLVNKKIKTNGKSSQLCRSRDECREHVSSFNRNE
jgi:hypothetical protein